MLLRQSCLQDYEHKSCRPSPLLLSHCICFRVSRHSMSLLVSLLPLTVHLLFSNSSLSYVHSSVPLLAVSSVPLSGFFHRPNLPILESDSLDNTFVSIYGIWAVFYAMSLWKTAPWQGSGVKVNREKTYEMGMGDMKFHTKYWSEKLRRRNHLCKYSHNLEITVRIYREAKESRCGAMWLSIGSCVRPLWTRTLPWVPRNVGNSLIDGNK